MNLKPYARIIRFAVVGGTAAILNVLILYSLTNWFGLWYVASEIIAFIVAVFYNFTLQKIWTFANPNGRMARQGFWFVVINIVNLFVNTFLLYCFVEFFGLWYVAGQIIASLLIAAESYFIYRAIFR